MAERDIEVSLGRAEARIIIDGNVIYSGEEQPVIPYTFEKGRHKIEVEYINNWHTTDFFVSICPKEKIHSSDEVKEILSKHLSDNTKIWYVGVYESNHKDHVTEVVLQKSANPVILILTSSGAVNWKISNPHKVKVKSIVYSSGYLGTSVDRSNISTTEVIRMNELYFTHSFSPEYHFVPDGTLYYEDMGIKGAIDSVKKITDKPLDGFSGIYSTSSVKVPEVILNKNKYSEINKIYEKIEKEHKEKTRNIDNLFGE